MLFIHFDGFLLYIKCNLFSIIIFPLTLCWYLIPALPALAALAEIQTNDQACCCLGMGDRISRQNSDELWAIEHAFLLFFFSVVIVFFLSFSTWIFFYIDVSTMDKPFWLKPDRCLSFCTFSFVQCLVCSSKGPGWLNELGNWIT